MTCTHFVDHVLDLARQTELPSDARDHVSACESCSARLAQERRMRAALRMVADENRAVEAPAAVESALLARFRAAQAAAPVSDAPVVSIESKRSIRRWVIPAAIAAALVIAAFLLRQQPEQIAKQEPVKETPAPLAPQHEEPLVAKSFAAEAARVEAAPVRRAPRVTRSQEPREIATEFFPLVSGQVLDPAERPQLLRMNVPRAAMRSAGLPVREERLDERVPADVLVGEDGTPRAIRFVSLASYRY
jgi:hypothetical protein